MVWWIVSGVLVLAVLVFGAVLAALAGRLHPLRRELGRLQVRAEEAERLQTKAMAVQAQAEELAGRVEEVSASAERLRAHRQGVPPGEFDGDARVRGFH